MYVVCGRNRSRRRSIATAGLGWTGPLVQTQGITLPAMLIVIGAMLATGLCCPGKWRPQAPIRRSRRYDSKRVRRRDPGNFATAKKYFSSLAPGAPIVTFFLPGRITVGDDLLLKYGRNTKQHACRVGQISRVQDGGCTILRDSR